MPNRTDDLESYLPVLRADMAHLDYFLRDLSRGMGRITLGQVPDGSGDLIADAALSDIYWVLAGRPGNQIGYGGTSPSGTATISSTADPTKGFVLLGEDGGFAYDETNQYLGIGETAPSARAHITVGYALESNASPSAASSTANWAATGAATQLLCLQDSSDSTYCRFTSDAGGGTLNVDLDNLTQGLSDPGITSGFSLKITLQSSASYAARISVTMSNKTAGSIFSNKKFGGDGDVQPGNVTNVTTTFAEYTYTLSAGEVGDIDWTKQWTLAIANDGFSAGGTFDVSKVYIVVPGGGTATALQKWGDGTNANTLQYANDAAGTDTLQLSGSPFRIAASALEIDIGTPADGHVWTATDTEGTGAWEDPAHTLLDAVKHSDTVTHVPVLGDLIYANSTPAWQALAGNTTATKNFLVQTGTGAISAAPAWAALAASDLPAHDHSSGTTGGSDLNPQTLEIEAFAPFLAFRDPGIPSYGALYMASTNLDRSWTLPDSTGVILVASGWPSAGAIVYGAANPNPMAVLAIGASGTVLTSSGAAPQWSTNAAVVDIARTWATLQTFKDTTFKVVDDLDATKTLTFALTNSTANADLTLDFRSAVDRSLIWNLSGGTGGNLTLTWAGTADATLTLPSATGTVAVLTDIPTVDSARTWATLQTFKDTTFKIVDDADATKTCVFSLGGATANADLTLAWAGTVDRTVTIPDGTTTLAGLAMTQTFTTTNTFAPSTDVLGIKLIANTTYTANAFEMRDETNVLYWLMGPTGIHYLSSFLTIASGAVSDLAAGGYNTGVIAAATLTAGRTWIFPDANITVAGSTFALTSGRVVLAAAGGLLTTDADMTFSADTLTVTKIAATTFTGNLTTSAVNIVTDTTTGTKIGTGATQKLGFWNATPVVQPAAVADATGTLADVVTQFNDLLAKLRTIGLIAT